MCPPGCLQVLQKSKSVWAVESFMAEGDHIVFSFTPGFRDRVGRGFLKLRQTLIPSLLASLKIAGLLAGRHQFLRALWLKIKLVYIVGCPWCCCDRQCCHGDGYFNGCFFFFLEYWVPSCMTDVFTVVAHGERGSLFCVVISAQAQFTFHCVHTWGGGERRVCIWRFWQL